jgi:serine protease Do
MASGKNLWKLAGIGGGVVLTMLCVVALGRVASGQTPTRFVRSQLPGGNGIGVTVRDVDAADVKREKLPAESGAVIDDVRSDGPAAKAGLKAGDVIVSFDGEKVRSAQHFARLVEETPEGREVAATVIRDGGKVDVKVAPVASNGPNWAMTRRLGDLRNMTFPTITAPEKGTFRIEPFGTRTFSFFSRGRLGVSAQDLTEQLGTFFGAPEGALVTSVDESSVAKTAGLKAGDVITKINGNVVRNAGDLQRRLMDVSGETTITIIRDHKEQTLTVKLEDDDLMRARIRR